MNKYLAICTDDDALFAEQYTVNAANAKQALQRAMIKNHMEVLEVSAKEAQVISKNALAWSYGKCAGYTDSVWRAQDDANRWVCIKLGKVK